MGQKLVVGPFNRGFRNDVTPFVIDNDSFPTLINAYQWRGRAKRKRGTAFLTRFQRFISATNVGTPFNNVTLTYNLNIFTLLGLTAQTNASIVPGSVVLQIGSPSVAVFNDPGTGTLTPSFGTASSGSINYGNGNITLTFTLAPGLATPLFIALRYYPGLPVMGLEDFLPQTNQYPGTLGFDTTYSYNILTTTPYTSYDISFYKNPAAAAALPGYVPKTTPTALTWHGQNYQQFWTTNYQNALWATNGIAVTNGQFDVSTLNMQFKRITNVAAIVAGPPASATLTIGTHGLVVGDFIFVNEIAIGTVKGINFQTGYVTNVIDANNVSVTFPNATLGGAGGGVTGIAQYLTSNAFPTKDCLRWYDGDPTNGNPTSPTYVQGKGWVNFCPPINFLTANPSFSIAGLTPAQYYLVGARIILPFKDRLLFFGPVIQTSSTGVSPIYLQDTVIYSQNGTAFYTCSYTNDPNPALDSPTSASNLFNPILVPDNQSATSPAYFEDFTGFGGFITLGVNQPIVTAAPNEDVIIIGFPSFQVRMIFSGNDVVPFNFFVINSELGSSSTFSAITLDKGILTRGSRGYVITSQLETGRIDLEIPDQVFEISLTNNGSERVTAQRDYISEWVYFSYPSNEFDSIFPSQTLQYNYRDNSWGVFNESYTTYGQFRPSTGFTWATIGRKYSSWNSWTSPWNAGSITLLQNQIIAGNQQGFVMIRDDGTDEEPSLSIQSISGSTITCINHGLNIGDYILISGALGTIGTEVNGKIFSVSGSNYTTNTFDLNPTIGSGDYSGAGLITRLYVPFIQTKQFPVAWGLSRKTRIGPQQYLFTKTDNAQLTLQIFLSQDVDNPYNSGSIVPPDTGQPAPINNSLIYSQVLYTCPESTNLGLTAANVNLQMPTASTQQQIWHRMNTSLIGDTVQIGFTLSDAQMRDLDDDGLPVNQFAEIELHSFILDVSPSQVLA